MAANNVDQYIAGLEPWQADIVRRVRVIIQQEAPQAKEAFKWSRPVYELNGPFVYMMAFKYYVNFGFSRGSELDDPRGLLQGTGEKMRHVKLSSVEDIDTDALTSFIRQAVDLNQPKSDPTQG